MQHQIIGEFSPSKALSRTYAKQLGSTGNCYGLAFQKLNLI